MPTYLCRPDCGNGKRCGSMKREELLLRISIDPQICFGKPCIRGRRIWVSLVLDLLATGMKVEEIMREYELAEEDVMACIADREEMARERRVNITPDRPRPSEPETRP